MEPLWTFLPLWTTWGPSKALISNKCPPPGYVPLDSLPSRQVILAGSAKGVADSEQDSLTLRACWIMAEGLIAFANQPMRRSLEHLPTVKANKRCCQLPFHASNAAELCCTGTARRWRPTWTRSTIALLR